MPKRVMAEPAIDHDSNVCFEAYRAAEADREFEEIVD